MKKRIKMAYKLTQDIKPRGITGRPEKEILEALRE